MRTVLLTGFEPFNGDQVNPAWLAVHALAGWGDGTFIVEARQLPCAFGVAWQVLKQAIAEVRPALVIAVGQAGGRSDISLERIAINIDDAPIPDNLGVQPIDRDIEPDGPAAYFSTLPIKAIVRGLRSRGIPAAVSQSAGTFVCNHVFYALMHAMSTSIAAPGPALHAGSTPDATIKAGFIHVPYLPVQAATHPGSPSMTLSDIVLALRAAIGIALASVHDDDAFAEGSLA